MINRRKYTYPVIACFMAFLIGVLCFSLRTAPEEYNSNEEKELAQHPRIYEVSGFDEYAESFDTYASDQFPARNLIIKSNNEAETGGETDTIVNDVYVLSSDYLFGYTYPTLDKDVKALANAIMSKRDESGLPFVYLIVPQKNLILGDSEPSVSSEVDEKNKMRLINSLNDNRISYVDCCSYMQSFDLEERSKFFYKTDMHWNEYGAYVAAEYSAQQLAYLGQINFKSIPSDSDFIWTDLTGLNYLGDFQKRFSSEVTIEEYIPFYIAVESQFFKYYRSLDGEEVPRSSIVASGLDSDPLDYNKISTYNLGYYRVENDQAAEDKHVLILKDSYECCMTDYYSELFSEIDVVDPRYDSYPSFDELVEARDIDMVLLIYHSNNISQELIDYLNE